MHLNLIFIFLILSITACESNEFKGSENVAPIKSSDTTSDINNNTIPDDFEDPKLVTKDDDNTTDPDLGKIFVPDGKGGFEEVEAVYTIIPDGIEKLDEILKKSDTGFFQVENPNKPNSSNHPDTITSENGIIPDGFKEAEEIFIKTEDGFEKIDIYTPNTKNENGEFTDPSSLTDDDASKVPTIIIPDTADTDVGPPATTTDDGDDTREPTACELDSINFEDMLGSPAKTQISNQYATSHGVSFELSDGTHPTLIEHDKAVDTTEFIGWVCNFCTVGIPSPFGDGTGTLNGVLAKDQKRLGKYSIGGPNKDRYLIVNYTNPVKATSGTLIDVDGSEKWDIIAYDQANNVVGSVTVASLLNDGVGTDWKLNLAQDFVKLELRFSLSNTTLGGGLALDLFSPSKACEN